MKNTDQEYLELFRPFPPVELELVRPFLFTFVVGLGAMVVGLGILIWTLM